LFLPLQLCTCTHRTTLVSFRPRQDGAVGSVEIVREQLSTTRTTVTNAAHRARAYHRCAHTACASPACAPACHSTAHAPYRTSLPARTTPPRASPHTTAFLPRARTHLPPPARFPPRTRHTLSLRRCLRPHAARSLACRLPSGRLAAHARMPAARAYADFQPRDHSYSDFLAGWHQDWMDQALGAPGAYRVISLVQTIMVCFLCRCRDELGGTIVAIGPY